jgi:long-chain fatty acid transport protein
MRRLAAALLLMALVPVQEAGAGGFDTPIMYSARHMGMGGAAIGYVNDPTAVFHNPAGLAHTDLLSVTLDFSPLIGGMTTSPSYSGQNVESNTTFAPFFIGAVSYRVWDRITLGVGVYPVASAGASYDYDTNTGVKTHDETKIAFIEIAPGLAVDLPLGFKVGAVWRATMLSFRRLQHSPGSGVPGMFDMDLSGMSYAGYRVGLQWSTPIVSAGLVYRSRTDTTVEGDASTLVLQKWGKTSMPFVLPAKIGAGVKVDLQFLAAALDVEWGFHSQNGKVNIRAESLAEGGTDLELPNYYMWKDAPTVRLGVELPLLPIIRARAGYVYDGETSNKNYPSAFGTPPTATHSLTAGLGVSLMEFLEANVAYAYRFGSVTVPDAEPGTEVCLACSKPGDYSIGLHGFFVDVGLKL